MPSHRPDLDTKASAMWSQEVLQAAHQWSTEEAVKLREDAQEAIRCGWLRRQRWEAKLKPLVAKARQLQECNFLGWLEMMKGMLHGHGLWIHVRYPRLPHVTLSAGKEEELERNDIWAVNLLLTYIQPSFYSRIPIARPVTEYELIHKLEQAAKPFRLMDLPCELRDSICTLCLVVPQRKRYHKPEWMRGQPVTDENRHRLYRTPKFALSITAGQEVFLPVHPPLLSVSRQVRDEADAIYSGKNEWAIEMDYIHEDESGRYMDLDASMEQVQRWVAKIGMHRLKHLRDFTLGVEMCWKMPKDTEHHPPIRKDVIGWHQVATELRRRSNRWKGEGIIDFFLGEKEFWTEYLFSFPGEHDSDDDNMVEEEYDSEGSVQESEARQAPKEWWTTM